MLKLHYIADLIDKINIAIFEYNVKIKNELNFRFLSDGFKAIYEEQSIDKIFIIQKDFLYNVHPSDIETLSSTIENSILTFSQWEVEFRVIVNNNIKWLRASANFDNSSPEDMIWYGYIEDITKQKLEQNSTIKIGERLKNLTQKLDIGVYEFTISSGEMKMIFVNQAYENIFFGEKVEDILNDVSILFNYVHEDDISLINATMEESIQNLTPWNIEYRIRKGDEIKWIKGKATPERKPDGSTTWYGYIKDITKRKEEFLQLKLLESVITHTKDMIMITEAEPMDLSDGGPKILYVNEAFSNITGYTKEELKEKTPRILQGPKSSRLELDKLKSSMKKWESHTVEIINYKKNGEEFWNNFTLVPVANDTGWFTHWISIERDITAQKVQQEELEKKNKMLQEIAFHNSHILRAPVASLLGLINILLEYPEEYNKSILEGIYKSAEDLDAIIKQMAKVASSDK